MKNANGESGLERVGVKDLALDFGKAWEYAPSVEATDHVKLQKRLELFVDGKWVAPKSGDRVKHQTLYSSNYVVARLR